LALVTDARLSGTKDTSAPLFYGHPTMDTPCTLRAM